MKKLRLNVFRLLFIAYSILIIVSCNEKKQFDGYLYPIRENGLYGYIDSVGNRIIEPEFLWVSTFHNGLAMAVVDTIYREVPDSMAYEVGERDTIINVYRMYAKYGYIDKSGDFVIEPKFISYVNMNEIGDVAYDMDDCSNALFRHSFRNGRAMYCDTTTWKNGYIDTKGNVVVGAKYYYSEPFSEGLAIVRDAVAEPLYTNKACITPSKLRCAYLDTLGNVATDFKYESLTRFCSGRGIGKYKIIKKDTVNIEDTTIVYETYSTPQILINKEGKEIKELNFNYDYYGFSRSGISVASDGFFMRSFIGKENISYYYIDVNGNFLEPLKGLSDYQLDSLGRCNDIMQVLPDDANIATATYFNEGFSGISPDKKHWFVIDKYLLIHGYGEESIFDGFQPFNNGLAAVKKNGKWGFINRKIKEQIPCKYDSCGVVYPYLEEVFECDIQGKIKKVAYINRQDSLVWECNVPDYREITNKYSVKEKQDWGKWSYKYNPVIENIKYWIIVGLGVVLILALISWEYVRVRATNRYTEMPTNEQSLQMQNNIDNNSSTNQISVTSTETEEIRFYPSVRQYTETIRLSSKSPEEFFDKLSNLRPVFDENGDPIMSNGNFAVVYKMVDENGKFHAVRCFHRYQEGRKNSYKLICEELNEVSSPYLSPIKYFENEFYIDSVEYPVLLMDWVDGIPLDKYIRKIINDKTKLRSLADNFRQLAIWLLNQPFAHGDLKPDNILVKDDGSLVLVDYDGMFVPAMQGQKAREIGSPDFRNPSRTEIDFDKNIDNFSIISILLSLELIASKSDYLERFSKEDRLLFSHDDYLNLRGSGIFKRALTSYDDDIPELAVMLERMVNGEQGNTDAIKKLLLTNNLHERLRPNEKIERKSSWFIGVCFFVTLLLPLYLRSVICWHIVMLFVTTVFLEALMYLVLVFVDRRRPNKKEHIRTIKNDGPAGYFGWINFIPLLLMTDTFTCWLNSTVPFLCQPFYESKWYITALVWVIWWFSNMAIISIPEYLLEWRLKYFKTKEEAASEQTEHELSMIRAEVAKEDKQWEEQKKRNSFVSYDDLSF